MGAGEFLGQEETGGFDDDIGADFVPLQIGRILLRGQADLLAVDDQVAAVDFDIGFEFAVDRVILQHVGEVFGFEQVVDPDDFDVIAEVLDRSAEDHAADTAETIDTNFDHFWQFPFVKLREHNFQLHF